MAYHYKQHFGYKWGDSSMIIISDATKSEIFSESSQKSLSMVCQISCIPYMFEIHEPDKKTLFMVTKNGLLRVIKDDLFMVITMTHKWEKLAWVWHHDRLFLQNL